MNFEKASFLGIRLSDFRRIFEPVAAVAQTVDQSVPVALPDELLAAALPASTLAAAGLVQWCSLRKVAEWRTHGVESHQLLLDATGALVVTSSLRHLAWGHLDGLVYQGRRRPYGALPCKPNMMV